MIVIIRGNQIYIKYIILLFPFYQQLKQYQVLYGKQNISLLFQYMYYYCKELFRHEFIFNIRSSFLKTIEYLILLLY